MKTAAWLSGASPSLAKEAGKFTLSDLKESDDEKVRCYHHLIDITAKDKVAMEESLVQHVKDTIDKLEEISGRGIEFVYFGKTYVDKKNPEPEPEPEPYFNRLKPETWKNTGIKARWEDHNSKVKTATNSRKKYVDSNYAKDGMVVLCAFTKDDLPTGSRRSQEYLALAMEQRLIHHFQIFGVQETIVMNNTFNQGRISDHTNTSGVDADDSTLNTCDAADPPEPEHEVYVIYMTFAYKPPKPIQTSTPSKPDAPQSKKGADPLSTIKEDLLSALEDTTNSSIIS